MDALHNTNAKEISPIFLSMQVRAKKNEITSVPNMDKARAMEMLAVSTSRRRRHAWGDGEGTPGQTGYH